MPRNVPGAAPHAMQAKLKPAFLEEGTAAPSTKDLQAFLKLDQLSLFWKNKVGRVLLVTAFANLGSTAGAWIAGSAIIGSLL